jgi:hypothetical protein
MTGGLRRPGIHCVGPFGPEEPQSARWALGVSRGLDDRGTASPRHPLCRPVGPEESQSAHVGLRNYSRPMWA